MNLFGVFPDSNRRVLSLYLVKCIDIPTHHLFFVIFAWIKNCKYLNVFAVFLGHFLYLHSSYTITRNLINTFLTPSLYMILWTLNYIRFFVSMRSYYTNSLNYTSLFFSFSLMRSKYITLMQFWIDVEVHENHYLHCKNNKTDVNMIN